MDPESAARARRLNRPAFVRTVPQLRPRPADLSPRAFARFDYGAATLRGPEQYAPVGEGWQVGVDRRGDLWIARAV
jgi:hypothetical protein